MTAHSVTLADRFDLSKHHVLLNGTQALVRLMLAQRVRDQNAGLNTAGYVTGYRGSPLGAVDMQMRRAAKELGAHHVVFEEGLNEDLAATAIWGTQQAELRGEGKYQGVFGLWYGKGPGVDRSGDVMRHVNMAGTSKFGGVLMALGDDHTGESSTVLHQSDWAVVDAHMPVLSPAGVQEILDLGHYGFALSRFSGLWVGLKTMKDTVEVTSVVDGNPQRITTHEPEFDMPQGGLNIRLVDTPTDQEHRLLNYKIQAAEAFARANRIDKRVHGEAGAKIGIVAAGKNWLDVVHVLKTLNLSEQDCLSQGITTYKVAQTWPLDQTSFLEWSEGLDVIICVEEKRKLIEVQIKEALISHGKAPKIYGAKDADSLAVLFPNSGALDPVDIAKHVGDILIRNGCDSEQLRAGLAHIDEISKADNAPDKAARLPYFCAGCPHNSSTKVPEGSRAYAGIGCHFMVQWMDRSTLGYTHMGGEGANWIGEAHFSNRDHVFQNIGDGTYNHSGIQAIRAAVAAGTNITYKILFNDAVAMTGGQQNDGGLGAPRIVRELQAMGIKALRVVYDDKEDVVASQFPSDVPIEPRDRFMEVQKELSQTSGVSAIVYIQTCAAEKRRRRKRGQFPDPNKRIFINSDVCEGCGDCGVQSNCVAIVPKETPFGRKRAIDQSGCNKDFSCLKGFCPSFVTVEGGTPKKAATQSLKLPDLPDPTLPAINGTHNIVITGIGGTGVVTIGAVLAQAAHIDGKGAGVMEMAGLAQKGGAVKIHCRLANHPDDISAIRVSMGECDTLIGGDLVVTAGAQTLALTQTDRTAAVVNAHEVITGEFTRNKNFRLPAEDMTLGLQAKLRDRLTLFDASDLAKVLLGDSIFSNMILLGAAWQLGQVPLSEASIKGAIELNGAAQDKNKQAFEIGRWAALYPDEAQARTQVNVVDFTIGLTEQIKQRADFLRDYQDAALSDKYMSRVEAVQDPELRRVVAESYFKILSYKDEYEVARLHLQTAEKAAEEFDGIRDLKFHLAPPLVSGKDANGRPKKRVFGSWVVHLFKGLARLKTVRGSRWDVFGYTAERKMERALIKEFEKDLVTIQDLFSQGDTKLAMKWAGLVQEVRGFGPVKLANYQTYCSARLAILKQLENRSNPSVSAAE